MMHPNRIAQLGDELYSALIEKRTLAPLTEREPAMTIKDAYHVSSHFLNRRLEDGERVVGKKIGVTSRVVQEMLQVHEPDFGFLTDRMQYPNSAKIPVASGLIQPRAEAEIAFRLKGDLRGPGVTEADVLDATESIMPCFEIVDSRIRDWKIKIQDTIADNASCGVYVLGDREVDPRELDLPNMQVKVYKNGSPLSEGQGRAVQGNPLTAVAWLANTLGEFGIPFKAGEIILSGSLVPLEPVTSGDMMHMDLTNGSGSSLLGSATISFA